MSHTFSQGNGKNVEVKKEDEQKGEEAPNLQPAVKSAYDLYMEKALEQAKKLYPEYKLTFFGSDPYDTSVSFRHLLGSIQDSSGFVKNEAGEDVFVENARMPEAALRLYLEFPFWDIVCSHVRCLGAEVISRPFPTRFTPASFCLEGLMVMEKYETRVLLQELREFLNTFPDEVALVVKLLRALRIILKSRMQASPEHAIEYVHKLETYFRLLGPSASIETLREVKKLLGAKYLKRYIKEYEVAYVKMVSIENVIMGYKQDKKENTQYQQFMAAPGVPEGYSKVGDAYQGYYYAVHFVNPPVTTHFEVPDHYDEITEKAFINCKLDIIKTIKVIDKLREKSPQMIERWYENDEELPDKFDDGSNFPDGVIDVGVEDKNRKRKYTSSFMLSEGLISEAKAT